MLIPLDLIRKIIEKFVKDSGPAQLRIRMQKAIPGIVTKMKSQGMTPDTTTLRVLVRDALFKLWRVVIPSGSITDLVRDAQDDKVVALVTEAMEPGELLDLTAIVEATMEAAIEVTF